MAGEGDYRLPSEGATEIRGMIDAFHWIVVPISTVLGLSIARLLGGYVTAFKARNNLRFDWLPLVFAGAILGVGLQFWWALLELSSLKDWSLSAFTLLIAMIMALFTAAALISPTEGDTDLRVAFNRDGRWALIALAVFHTLAIGPTPGSGICLSLRPVRRFNSYWPLYASAPDW